MWSISTCFSRKRRSWNSISSRAHPQIAARLVQALQGLSVTLLQGCTSPVAGGALRSERALQAPVQGSAFGYIHVDYKVVISAVVLFVVSRRCFATCILDVDLDLNVVDKDKEEQAVLDDPHLVEEVLTVTMMILNVLEGLGAWEKSEMKKHQLRTRSCRWCSWRSWRATTRLLRRIAVKNGHDVSKEEKQQWSLHWEAKVFQNTVKEDTMLSRMRRPTVTISNQKVNPEVWWQGRDAQACKKMRLQDYNTLEKEWQREDDETSGMHPGKDDPNWRLQRWGDVWAIGGWTISCRRSYLGGQRCSTWWGRPYFLKYVNYKVTAVQWCNQCLWVLV